MTRAVRAEVRTLLSTRPLLLILAGGVIVAGIMAAFARAAKVSDLLHTETIVLTLFVLLAGAIAGANEYQHKTLQWTLLGTPRRGTAATAKLLVMALAGAVAAAAILAVSWIVAVIVNGSLPVGVSLPKLIVGQLLLGALTGCFGLASGMVTRNLPAATGAVFTVALVLPIVFQIKHGLNALCRVLPFGEFSSASLALASAPASFGRQLSFVAAVVVMLFWTAVGWLIARSRFANLDF